MATQAGRGRIEWIDVAKGIGIILVVFGHCLLTGSTARQLIFSFHMPLFFFLAGCTFRPRGLKEAACRSAKSLLIPYCLLFFAWKVTRALAGSAGTFDVGALAGSFVFAAGTAVKPFGFPIVGMIWFLAALFLSRVVFEAQFALARRFAHPTRVVAACSLALSLAGYLWATHVGVYLPGNLEIALFCQQYMLAGYLLSTKAPKAVAGTTSPWWLWAALALAICIWAPCALHSSLSLAGRRFDGIVPLEAASFAGIAAVALASMLACRLPEGRPAGAVKRMLLFAGQNSMALFCIHALDWSIAWDPLAALAALPHANALSGLVRVASTFAVLCALRTGIARIANPRRETPEAR